MDQKITKLRFLDCTFFPSSRKSLIMAFYYLVDTFYTSTNLSSNLERLVVRKAYESSPFLLAERSTYWKESYEICISDYCPKILTEFHLSLPLPLQHRKNLSTFFSSYELPTKRITRIRSFHSD